MVARRQGKGKGKCCNAIFRLHHDFEGGFAGLRDGFFEVGSVGTATLCGVGLAAAFAAKECAGVAKPVAGFEAFSDERLGNHGADTDLACGLIDGEKHNRGARADVADVLAGGLQGSTIFASFDGGDDDVVVEVAGLVGDATGFADGFIADGVGELFASLFGAFLEDADGGANLRLANLGHGRLIKFDEQGWDEGGEIRVGEARRPFNAQFSGVGGGDCVFGHVAGEGGDASHAFGNGFFGGDGEGADEGGALDV